MSNKTKNVFISHVHKDDGGLTDLKNLLKSKGMEVRDSSINSDRPNNAKSPEYIKSEILAPRIDWQAQSSFTSLRKLRTVNG